MVNGTFQSIRVRALAALCLFFVAPTLAAAAPVRAGHLTAEIVADHAAIAPGGTIRVALRQTIDAGWHTYWRNPGDSGEATTLNWTLPAGWKTGAIVWPTPQQLRIGPLMDYGYTGEVLLPVNLTAPADARPGQTVTLKTHAAFLVCQDVCVPEDADLSLDLPVVVSNPPGDPHWGPRIAATLAAAPRPSPALKAAMTPGAATVKLSIAGARLKGADLAGAYFYPYDGDAIDAAQPQAIERGPDGLTLSLIPGSAFKTGKPPASLTGVLALKSGAFEVTAPPGPPLPDASGLGPPGAPAGLGPLAIAMGLAFLGGLILNLMPCVFPVLAMKAASLARHAHEPNAARIQGLAYLAGVVATFLALAGALIAARAAGQAVGWGFQLQSPAILAGLTLVMLLVALNLSGVFEAGTSLQAAAGQAEAADRGGALGAAFTGVLAVAVAAPCTAPFMGAAVGFALTQGPAIALGVFLALALGMAAPFVVLAFAPALLARMPRPGAWMEGLKKALAFPMYATAAWLTWVYAQSAGQTRLASLFAAAVLTGLAAWLYGAGQRARIAGARSVPALAASGLAIALALSAAFWPAAPTPAALASQPFSPDRLAELRAEHRPVFVNFTAAWCVTCQVNDRVALSGGKAADAFAKAGVVYLVGDWTDRDATIEQALAAHGRAGVPLYLMYPANGGEAQVLPQILTEGIVVDAAKKAAADAS
ncbi:MAG TPA: protein-disulfide reductase DsbD domain-containing protein [Caulobacteraceae bacterium]|nr:protein-disulfide reductase DsbD domain-containing protein [Caulobacteraceae bacterium]